MSDACRERDACTWLVWPAYPRLWCSRDHPAGDFRCRFREAFRSKVRIAGASDRRWSGRDDPGHVVHTNINRSELLYWVYGAHSDLIGGMALLGTEVAPGRGTEGTPAL